MMKFSVSQRILFPFDVFWVSSYHLTKISVNPGVDFFSDFYCCQIKPHHKLKWNSFCDSALV